MARNRAVSPVSLPAYGPRVKSSTQAVAKETSTQARDRKPDAFLLRSCLRIGGSIVGRVGHGEREAIDELGVSSFPQPRVVCFRFQSPAHTYRRLEEGLKNVAEDGPKSQSNLRLPENCKNLPAVSTVGARPTPPETADSAIRYGPYLSADPLSRIA